MIQEIVYTSAPRGLAQESRDFCVVASSEGMPQAMADLLIALSSYKHLFPAGDARNPTLRSLRHRLFGGQMHYVLSQVTDCGLDHLGRLNKLAHHIALTDEELLEAGPTALLCHDDGMQSTWDAEPQILSPRTLPDSSANAVCPHAWQQITGDAGWAGFLAEHFLRPDTKPICLIHGSEIEPLTLYHEALMLLEPSDRWSTSFTTYDPSANHSQEYGVRSVPTTSPHTYALRADPRYETIDLSEPLPPPPESTWVDRARSIFDASNKPEAKHTSTI